MSAADELVSRLRSHAKRSIEHNVREVLYAEVTGVDPLTAEFHDHDLELDEDDLVLGATAKQWDATVGIEEGDTLAVRQIAKPGDAEDDWLVLEVLSENEAPAPQAAARAPRAAALAPQPVRLPLLPERPEPDPSAVLMYALDVEGTIMACIQFPDGKERYLP